MPGRQQIPRPAGVRPGGPPPWVGADERTRHPGLQEVRAALATIGPAQPSSAQIPTLKAELPFGGPPAAVLVPIFEEDGEAHVILTRRSDRLRSHTGEVSFPGGRLEPNEAPLAAALRESTEEVGLDASTVEILGQLEPLSTMSSRAGITPFVGALPGRPPLQPNPHEVAHAFDVSLSALMAEGVYREERWDTPWADDHPVYFFDLPEDIVWGATARMLYRLLELVVLNGRTG
jgi:8-oxo-dGTP pyrophosphatase MutT (NUDIX family)